MTWKEIRFLVLMWILLAAAFVCTLPLLPLPPFAILSAGFLTLLIYYSVFLPLYLLLRLAFWPLPPGRWRQWTADVVALSATVIIAFIVPLHFNPIVRAKAAALQVREMPAPIMLASGRSVALLRLEGNSAYQTDVPAFWGNCDEFCTALLVSGYAKDVTVGLQFSRTGEVTPHMIGVRYAISGKRPECIMDDKEWLAWFAGKSRSQASQIGDFSKAFVARYTACISAEDTAPFAKADVIFLDYYPYDPYGQNFRNVDWSLEPATSIASTQTLLENRDGKMIVRVRRSNMMARELDTPMYLSMSEGPNESAYIAWAKTTFLRSDPGPFIDGGWGLITNGEDIYAEALARDRVAAIPAPRALSRRRKMK
jgi:hypothetical protein